MSNREPSKIYNYGAEIGRCSLKGAAVGIAGKLGYDFYNKASETSHVVFREAASIDETVGKAIVEKGGKAGEAAIKVDKWQGDFWSKVFGRTPEKQKEWREKQGITEQPTTGYTYQRPLPCYGGDLFLTAALLFGIAVGYIKGNTRYKRELKDHKLMKLADEMERQRIRSETNES